MTAIDPADAAAGSGFALGASTSNGPGIKAAMMQATTLSAGDNTMVPTISSDSYYNQSLRIQLSAVR
jgi:hypothetical protein